MYVCMYIYICIYRFVRIIRTQAHTFLHFVVIKRNVEFWVEEFRLFTLCLPSWLGVFVLIDSGVLLWGLGNPRSPCRTCGVAAV